MALLLDYFNKIIAITSPTIEVDAQELSDFIEDGMATPVGLLSDGANDSFLGDIQKPEGKIEDENNPGLFSQIIIILNPEWQIQFWQGSGYTRLFGGKIVGGVAGQPMKATGAAGDITVLESPVDGLAIKGSMTTEQSTKLDDIHGQVLRSVFIDTELGVNGNGYQQTPFNNWTSGVDYAEANGLSRLVPISDATVDRQLKNFTIDGVGLPTIDMNAQIMDKTIFRLCGLTGSYSGDINAIECSLINLSGLNGVLFTVNAFGTLKVAPGGNVTIWNVKQAFAGLGWGLDMNTGTTSKAAIHESVGDVTVINMDDADDLLEYNGTGDITFNPSCLAGTARVTGDVRITDNSGPLCNVIDETDSKRTEEMHTRLGLEKGNAWTDTPTQSGDDSGDIVIDNTGDAETSSTATRQ